MDKDIPISLKQFIAEQRAILKRFETDWIENRMIDPDSEYYLEEMDVYDWQEHLEIFLEEEEE